MIFLKVFAALISSTMTTQLSVVDQISAQVEVKNHQSVSGVPASDLTDCIETIRPNEDGTITHFIDFNSGMTITAPSGVAIASDEPFFIGQYSVHHIDMDSSGQPVEFFEFDTPLVFRGTTGVEHVL